MNIIPLLLAVAVQAAPLDTRVTIQVKNAPLNSVLDTMSAQAKVNFILSESFKDQRVDSDLKDVKMSKALSSVLEPAGLVYRRLGKGNTYLVTRKGAKPAGKVTIDKDSPALQTRVKVKVTEAPLNMLFETVAAQSKMNFTLAPGMDARKVTVGLDSVTVRELLEILAELKGLNIKQTGPDTFSVGV